jgi:hypothetical protein
VDFDQGIRIIHDWYRSAEAVSAGAVFASGLRAEMRHQAPA